MLDPDLIERIRTIFLHDQPYVSIADAAVLLGWSCGEIAAAMRTREIEPISRARENRWPAEVLDRQRAAALPSTAKALLRVAPGKHVLVLSTRGYRSVSKSIDVPVPASIEVLMMSRELVTE